jgi:hypothetical protein
MLRRIVIVSLAAALISPVFTAAPALAVVLFTCSAYSGNITISPLTDDGGVLVNRK